MLRFFCIYILLFNDQSQTVYLHTSEKMIKCHRNTSGHRPPLTMRIGSFTSLNFFTDITEAADVDIEAHLQIDPFFMKKMENTLRMQSVLLRSDNNINDDIPGFRSKSIDDIMESQIPQFERKMEDDEIITEKHEERLQKQGVKSIESVADYLRSTFKFTVENSFVNETCELYIAKLKSYFNFIVSKKTYDDIDKQHIVFDKVDMAQALTSSLVRTLINEILVNNTNISKKDKYVMTEAVSLFALRNKQTEMQYVCRAMGICRPFPGFSDHFARILSEVLKLYNIKFQYLIVKSAHLLIGKRPFLKTILRDEIVEYFKERATNIVDSNMTDIREGISVLRSVITQRHRMVNVNDDAIKSKTKAVRIILDIIDTVFDKGRMDEFETKADTVVSAIQDWAANLVTDIEPILNTFITESVASLKFGLTAVANEEIKILADVTYYGKPVGNQFAADYLMTKGSKFVNGLNIQRMSLGDYRKHNRKINSMLYRTQS